MTRAADHIAALDRDQFVDLRHIWARFAILRTDLSHNISVIRNWLWEDHRAPLPDAAEGVAATAIALGLLDLYADTDTRRRIDSAITARGQIFTPPGAAALIAQILGPTPAATFYEPTVGTVYTLGQRVSRSIITNIENDRRDYVSVAEFLLLAGALRIPPILLVAPVGRHEEIEPLPVAIPVADPWLVHGCVSAGL